MDNSGLVSMFCFSKKPIPKALLSDQNVFQREIPDEIQTRFLGREWCAVNLGDWRNVATVIAIKHFMTAGTFYYYVPSLLVGVLDNFDFVDWPLEALVPSSTSRVQKGKWWFDYFSLFSARQRAAVLEFIYYIDKAASEYVLDTNLLGVARQIWRPV
ncbi:MAG: hypothetical protein FWF12_07660 [Betaproteobacteria bacterium]|nr:hypothetical protein [Betaproteobacteria bacterium]